MTKTTELVKMGRDESIAGGGPLSADVHPEEVENMRKGGWVAVEPEPQSDELPEDFPGVAELQAVGITTIEQVRKTEDLTKIPGIGKATADKIAGALK